MPSRVCVVCGMPFLGSGQRCREHRRSAPSRAQDQAYQEPAYRRTRRLLLEEWVRQHGWWCPGVASIRHAPHPSHDLTLDHVVPIRRGGSLTARSNLRVCCRSANDQLRHVKP